MGLQNKIIRGEGEFTGPDAYENFRKLAALFEENKGGKLVHPVWPTMRAYFDAMDDFDYDDPAASLPGLKRYTMAVEGDTLRILAAKFNVTVEQMCSMNPTVAGPDTALTVGQIIRFR